MKPGTIGIGNNIVGQLGSGTNTQHVASSDGLTQRFRLEGFGRFFR